jgi:hypothetical protein
MLTIRNNNDFAFTGRYNGIDYDFPAGATVAVPEDAARHIFGVGVADKAEIMTRHGWLGVNANYDVAMQKLNNFSFNVADQFAPGEVVDEKLPYAHGWAKDEAATEEPEQGSAPLQTGSGGDGNVPDGAVQQPPQPTTKSKNSILDVLNEAV